MSHPWKCWRTRARHKSKESTRSPVIQSSRTTSTNWSTWEAANRKSRETGMNSTIRSTWCPHHLTTVTYPSRSCTIRSRTMMWASFWTSCNTATTRTWVRLTRRITDSWRGAFPSNNLTYFQYILFLFGFRFCDTLFFYFGNLCIVLDFFL